MRPTLPTMRFVAFAASMVAWVVCFRLLVRYGNWLPFVAAGSLLATFCLISDPDARSLARPTVARAAIGVAGALVMIAVTYASFAVLQRALPAIEHQTRSLYGLLGTGEVSTPQRAALVVFVASAEEVIFRGSLLGAHGSVQHVQREVTPVRPSLLRLAAFTGLYAAPAAASGSPLLVVVALICGLYWGGLRIISRSVFAPILAHVAWDLSILVVRPLL